MFNINTQSDQTKLAALADYIYNRASRLLKKSVAVLD